jgi:hypothetical protein
MRSDVVRARGGWLHTWQLIWLVVNVPVLSEQMTVVQPSVSTLGSFLHSQGQTLQHRQTQRSCALCAVASELQKT